MISVAIVTLTFLVPHLQYYESTLSVVENDELVLDDEEVQQQQQQQQKLSEGIQNYNSFNRLECHVMIDRQIEEISANIMSMTTTTTTTTTPQPTALLPIKFPKVILRLLSICWIKASFAFVEPLLALRLEKHFHVRLSHMG